MIRPLLNPSDISDVLHASLPSNTSPQDGEAILAWRRAVEAPDVVEAALALSEATEFYVAGIPGPHVFDKKARDRLLKQALSDFTGTQRDRIASILGGVNDPPLLARLRAALLADGVPYVEEEFIALKETRDARNDFVHGRTRTLPTEACRRSALSLFSRMLLYRAYQRRSEAGD